MYTCEHRFREGWEGRQASLPIVLIPHCLTPMAISRASFRQSGKRKTHIKLQPQAHTTEGIMRTRAPLRTAAGLGATLPSVTVWPQKMHCGCIQCITDSGGRCGSGRQVRAQTNFSLPNFRLYKRVCGGITTESRLLGPMISPASSPHHDYGLTVHAMASTHKSCI